MAFEQLGAAEACFDDHHREFTLRALRVRPTGRVVPGHEAPPGRHVVRARAGASNAYYGAWALSNEEDELGGRRVHRAHPGERGVRPDLAVEMIQMHGGVGYTWEYDCHLFYRRAKS